jgi:hypothetical protein
MIDLSRFHNTGAWEYGIYTEHVLIYKHGDAGALGWGRERGGCQIPALSKLLYQSLEMGGEFVRLFVCLLHLSWMMLRLLLGMGFPHNMRQVLVCGWWD